MPEPAAITPLPRRKSIGADIAEQLQRHIREGLFPPGSTLPSQRELALRFGASVPSVREAISVLVASGVLEARIGSGTVVRSLASSTESFTGWLGVAASTAELTELMEARALLERFTMQRAAHRLTPEHIGRLRHLLGQMEAALTDPAQYVEVDMNLHLAISEIAGNQVVCRLMREIQEPLRQQVSRSVTYLHEQGRLHESLEDHRVMLESLIVGEPELAFERVNRMINRALNR